MCTDRIISAARSAAVLLVGIAAVSHSTPASAQHDTNRSLALRSLKVIDTSFIDHHARACTDFFQFANGAWLARDSIPASYSSSGVARDMGDRNELVVRSVLEDAMARITSLPRSSTERKLGTFYRSCMDSTAAEQAGIAPIRTLLSNVTRINSRESLVTAIAELHRYKVGVAFGYAPQGDYHDPTRYVVYLSQGGLGMPDRDYYTNAGPSADSLRTAFVDHIGRVFVLAGGTPNAARAKARKVMALETELARASLTRVEQRDPTALDHPMSTRQLAALAPNIDWMIYLRQAGVTVPVTRVIVNEPAFLRRVSQLVNSVPLSDWRDYLRYHVIETASPWLSMPFVRERFAYTQRFTGEKELLPRWKRCLRRTDASIGEALGQAYVARTFSPEARARARSVIDDIRSSFAERVKRLAWMSDSTRARALEKLARMREKVGYPEHWRDYSRLAVAAGPFATNVLRANAFEWDRVANRPGAVVDTTEWAMTVPTVNAYYDPQLNEMAFPAGALTPQTFDAAADDAANYGSLGGSWAGHELTHGFDDEGRHFDARGSLRDWWLPADSVHFSQQAKLVADQYSGYVQVDTLHVNGRLTLGENIADYGGVLTGYDALQRALDRSGRPGLIEGYTPEQRYFLAYAQSYRAHVRPEALRTRQVTDAHSPERWRVNGPLSNMPAFAAAFGCTSADPMARPNDLIGRIW
jgi:putative endopeptidase